METSFTVGFLFLLQTLSSYSLKTETLCGEWTVNEATGKYSNLKANVPGGIYSDLMNNNIIADVFYGYNDTETRWVAQTHWIYTRTFLVDDTILNHDKVNIVFEGLDTYAAILINDVEIGTTRNMFLRYIFDVKEVLQRGNNTLEVRFASPMTVGEILSQFVNYTIPPECPPAQYRGECHVNQLRKMQASFSWDWGPALPSMGIWKEVYLEAFNSSVIRYVLVDYHEAPSDSWSINITTYLNCKPGETINGQLELELDTDVTTIAGGVQVNHTNTDEDNEVAVNWMISIPTLTVKRWWPNGYGEHKLYDLRVNFTSGSEESLRTIRIGFRTIELVQEKMSAGLGFYFKVNDVPIFAKGANEIPLNILPERGQDPEIISRILNSAYETNMNMLRVWGGGVYESDHFYEKADELGILIWQDFMFACAMYPAYPEYLSNVIAEIHHQVKRLHNHPSIAVWAGNNENEAALMANWYNTIKNITTYKNDYIKLYIDTIKEEFDKFSNAIFLASSPSNGEESEEEHYLAKNPQDPLYGDVHFYNYLLNPLDINTYPIPRFASEFGYQSLPDVDTWLTVTDNLTDLHPESLFMDHRQHHPFGLIENNLLMNYQLTLNSSSANYYKAYIFYSQILQAVSIKFETEYYRSFMGRINGEGQGNTMGALFWQLNDVWVAPTWSSIDYTGKWKMLQYFAKSFFAPTLVTGFLDTERRLRIYVVSEVASLIGATLDVSVIVEVYNWNSFQAINSTQFDVSLEFGKSVEITEIDTDSFLHDLGCGSLSEARTNCFFYLTLYSANVIIAPNNFIVATTIKNSNVVETTVEISSIRQIDDKGTKFEITVTSNGISLFVWLDSHQLPGRFSDNGFIQVTPEKVITFQSEVTTTAAVLKESITVTHLKDDQYF